MDFFGRQDIAKRNTRILTLYFIMAVILILAGVNFVFSLLALFNQSLNLPNVDYWTSNQFLFVTFSTLGIILFGNLVVYFDLRNGGSVIAEQTGASIVDMYSSDPRIKQYINIVEEMSIASGVILPILYIHKYEKSINAFVAGLDADNAALVITQGALEKLDREALQGVIGHEFSHILHDDLRINMRLIGTVNGISMIGETGYSMIRSLFESRYHSHRHSRANTGALSLAFILVGLGLFLVGYIGLFFGRLIKATISRQREYLADASAVQYTRSKNGIAKALTIILYDSNGSLLETKKAERIAHMCFGEAISLSSFFATHPPLGDRIKAISPAFLAQYKIKKRAKKQDIKEQNNSPSFKSSGYVSSFSNSNEAIKITNDEIIQSIGSPQPIHIEVAHNLLNDMPDVLHLAAYNSNSAQALIFAIILSAMTDKEKISFSLIEDNSNSNFQSNTGKYYKELKTTHLSIRLPLIELCIPELRKLESKEKISFIKTCIKLSSLDKKTSLFEFVLITILKSELITKRKRQREHHTIKPVIKSIERVLTLLIYAGRNKDANDVFKRYMSKFRHNNLDILPLSECKHTMISKDLIELSRANAKIKKNILSVFVDCIVHDNIAMPEEAELLRAISMEMGCPMPPLVANTKH